MADKTSKNTKPTTKPKKKSTSAAAPKRASTSRAPRPYTSNKPLFSAGTIITLVTFILVVVVALYISQKKETDAATATPEGGETSYVFTEADGNPTSIKIEPAGGETTVQIDRNEQNVWELILPVKAEAEPGRSEAAASQVMSISVVTPEISGDPANFGLDAPAHVITVKFTDDKTRILEIGDRAITDNGYYARLDKGKIMLVSLSAIDALIQLLEFPPYLNPPTPTAPPATETPVPVADTPTLVPTADVTVTPTP
jgi:hypothetical protein